MRSGPWSERRQCAQGPGGSAGSRAAYQIERWDGLVSSCATLRVPLVVVPEGLAHIVGAIGTGHAITVADGLARLAGLSRDAIEARRLLEDGEVRAWNWGRAVHLLQANACEAQMRAPRDLCSQSLV